MKHNVYRYISTILLVSLTLPIRVKLKVNLSSYSHAGAKGERGVYLLLILDLGTRWE
jgi:hypothetical protein